ncbi:hypothetical protein HELRODRAFT_172581 [Helobdella robusta]|uniref:Uncharacterized protein n=1 Tax=Helobdella robusta TaxID=6412 RepID=T1F5J9_HELRO|nr:hypothetical protein HELRODRAFT_172581 [Helobdella robusta]ESO04229.1 hypothetical protein HELRODRAFT_172581 [Helobdella robusta]
MYMWELEFERGQSLRGGGDGWVCEWPLQQLQQLLDDSFFVVVAKVDVVKVDGVKVDDLKVSIKGSGTATSKLICGILRSLALDLLLFILYTSDSRPHQGCKILRYLLPMTSSCMHLDQQTHLFICLQTSGVQLMQ